MQIEKLSEGIIKGRRRELAKAITLIESTRPEDKEKALLLMQELPDSPASIRVGISGVPGVGKSTFIEALGNAIIGKGHKVAVLAVDPSSPTSGGSILGDKTRMESLSTREEAFIRPSPTSGTLGGVAKKTRESMLLCEAAGYDVILIETVGVGQSEFEVASMVDCFTVLMLPGAGDSLQGIKRGILEITDIMIVNKADGDQKKLAQRSVQEYKSAFHLLSPKYSGMEVQFLTVSSTEKKGIEESWKSIEQFIHELKEHGHFTENRKRQELNWFNRLVEDEVLNRLWTSPGNESKKSELYKAIRKGELTASVAAEEMLRHVYRNS